MCNPHRHVTQAPHDKLMLLSYTQVTYTSACTLFACKPCLPAAYAGMRAQPGVSMPSAHCSCHLGFFKHRTAAVAALWAFFACLVFTASAQAQVTLLVPSQPSVEAPSPRPKQDVPAKREDKKDEKRPQEASLPTPAQSRRSSPQRRKASPRPTATQARLKRLPSRNSPRPQHLLQPPHPLKPRSMKNWTCS